MAVAKGTPLRRALSEALGKAKNLGGQERRFTALAVRELSRHLRLLELALRLLDAPVPRTLLVQDQALLRLALWRRLFCGATPPKVLGELGLPGPLRPRTVDDAALEAVLTRPLPDFPQEGTRLARLATRHSLPTWLSERLAEQLPEARWGAAFEALNREAPLQLRVRPGGDREALRAGLVAEGITVEPVAGLSDAWVVAGSGHRVFEARALKEGRLQVQDLGSQLIVALCGPAEALLGRTVADLCAGAGGKTLALADRVGARGVVWAADSSERRLADARVRVGKLKLSQVRFADAVPLQSVDLALIDAPCSGVGSLAREPDVRWSLVPARVEALTNVQDALLEETARGLRPGARLVYATCSLLREENEARIEAFLERHPDYALEPAGPEIPARFVRDGMLRVWPHEAPGSGFFAARMKRLG